MVRLADQLYQCRRTLRAVFGANYDDTVGLYRKHVAHIAKCRNLSVIQAALAMVKEVRNVDPDPMLSICLLAAAVDLIEGETAVRLADSL